MTYLNDDKENERLYCCQMSDSSNFGEPFNSELVVPALLLCKFHPCLTADWIM